MYSGSFYYYGSVQEILTSTLKSGSELHRIINSERTIKSGAKSEGICLLFKIKGYLCIVVGNRPRETLQNGAVFRWSNRGRQSLLPKYNSKIYRHLIAWFDSWWYHRTRVAAMWLSFLYCVCGVCGEGCVKGSLRWIGPGRGHGPQGCFRSGDRACTTGRE